MKRAIPTALILMLVLGTAMAPVASAGWLDKWTNDKTESKVPPRYDLYPTMSFHTGLLGQDVRTGWTLDGFRLALAPDCEITSEAAQGGGLDQGRKALVMGSKVGDTIVAWRIQVLKSDSGQEASDSNIEFTPSEVDPTVGEGTGPE